ncbi:MAG: carboxylesterase/lipase family protein [Pseudomonas sp.]
MHQLRQGTLLRPTLTALASALLAISLTGCLSGGGGGSGGGSAPPPPDPSLNASTSQGDFRGIALNGMRTFRGIRYGAAPVGDLRFAAPQPAPAHEERIQLSSAFGSACPQAGGAFGPASNNEDCLFLNVYAPAEPGDYPVMVWIHGGAFVAGDGGSSYEPQRLVEEGVVVVTLNYRLGMLGFLPHEALGSSNFGLQDQQLALKWVQENISAFDGDPDNVTIFGESAGGHSVLSQVASPGADDLFHKAIVQSGSYNGDQIPLADVDVVVATIPGGQTLFGNPFVNATGCSSDSDEALVSCLRNLSVSAILAAQPGNIIPVTGTATLPLSINAALTAGEFNEVPIMMGSNRDEGALFTLLALGEGATLTTLEGYNTAVAALLSENPRLDSAEIAAYYAAKQNPLNPAPYITAYTEIGTDWRFNCPNNSQWSVLEDQVDTWSYWFTDRNAPNFLGTPTPFPLGAAHAFEIQYVLNSFETLEGRGAGADQLSLADHMTKYWTNFAKFSDPNSTDGAAESVNWPRYTEGGSIIRLDAPTPSAVPVSDFRTTHECSFWANPPLRPIGG